MLHVFYLVHDLSDPAVRRRVDMLQAGGANVTLAGFRRADKAADGLDALSPIDLGQTHDGKFSQRLGAVGKAALVLGARLRGVRRPDVIIGRNLEMLALARRARSMFGGEMPVVYECLDIHRLLLGNGGVSRAMRAAERMLGGSASLLMTSSPAFVRDYFQRFSQIEAPVALLQNKVLELHRRPGPAANGAASLPAPGEPWVIGWFGALRCRKSLELLAAFTRQAKGRFKVVLRGRPAYTEFADFDGFVAAEPHMRFGGAYRNPEDLAAIYGEVHFAWAIDFFEEGLNSRWLLPNRLYEGCLHGAVPIAMADTETGRFLAERHMGLRLEEPSVEALGFLLGAIDAESFTAMRDRIAAEDRGTWVCDRRDCIALVERLKGLTARIEPAAMLQTA
jgi:succinoglycan biosynthesis protein ExoL